MASLRSSGGKTYFIAKFMSGTERLDFISSRQAKMLTDTEIPLVPLILISRKVFFELASAGLSFLLKSGPNPKVGSPKSAKLE